MTLPIPSSPSAGNSPASEDSNAPRTPLSPTLPLPAEQASTANTQSAATAANGNNQGQTKRKPSRRANTAERRATHNAVERQRRETLNGRFLEIRRLIVLQDLAALLPNLSQIRRPSKSSIVNSSIAHIHASRRHRLMAARELRAMKVEADALHREVNIWRDRAGLPRLEEPVRSEAFSMVLSGELEVIAAVPGDDEDEDGQGYGNYGDDDEDFAGPMGNVHGSHDDMDERHAGLSMLKNANANPFAHSLPPNAGGNHLTHILPRPAQGGPMISSPTVASFENPAMGAMYEQHESAQHFMQQQYPDVDKVTAWNTTQLYQQQSMLQAQRSLFTPPATSHGLSSSQSNPDHGRGRSGSLEAGSGYGSPVGAGHISSSPGSFEMPSALSSGEYIPRRMTSGGAGLHVNTGVSGGASGSWLGTRI
ncbi:Helix-loop-helix transcriptional regulator family [Salix suchowensis]|nr:Helix-loop-helix transcriptional regulator family [Salix suchowensis]